MLKLYFKICDYEGNEIPYQVVDIKRGMTHRITEQHCENVDIHRVTFMAHLPASGMCEYRIVPSKDFTRYLSHLNSGIDYMENRKLCVKINPNGSICIYDKLNCKTYDNQLSLVDDGEIGDGWSHCNPRNDRAVMSSFGGCSVEKIESGCSRCVFRITKKFMAPEKEVGGQLQGEHEFNFCLIPLDSDISYADLVYRQDIMGVGLISAYAEVDAASFTNAPTSNFKLSGDNIILSVLKCAEREENAYIVRMFNASDKASVATLEFANKVKEAIETNMNEECLEHNNTHIDGEKVELEVAPWHVSTIMVKFC